MNEEILPDKCCKNVADDGPFKSCDEFATHWYRHENDICSYCDKHDYVCGKEIKPTRNSIGSE